MLKNTAYQSVTTMFVVEQWGNIFLTNQTSFFREKEKKLEEMKTQKTEFKEGFWNVNSILMGGLGKDPVIEGKF